MISRGMNRWMTILVLASIGSLARSGEPNEIPIRLEFELSPTAPGPFSAARPAYGPADLWVSFVSGKPAYVAGIPVAGPTDFLPMRGMAEDFRQFAEQRAGLSDRQKLFLTAIRDFFRYHWHPSRLDPNGPERMWLYAVTREDAEKMARAFFQYASNEFRKQVAVAEREIRVATENTESAQKSMAEIDARCETTRRSLEDFQKTVPYRTEIEAQEAIGELDRMLNTAQVEIAGITAKIEAIQSYRQEKQGFVRDEQGRAVPVQRPPTPPETTAKLNTMFIEESIALRGAQARKQMATVLREQASRFVDLKSTLAKAPEERVKFLRTLEAAQRGLSSWQARLARLKEQEPRIPAKVILYPVPWVDEAPGIN